MRKKFAKRWRREALRRGAKLYNEGRILTKYESKVYGSPRGFSFDAKYNGHMICIIARDELDAYRMLVQDIDYGVFEVIK